MSEEDIKLIKDEGSFDRFKDVDYVLLKSDKEIFKKGVQFIDSPGLEESVSRTKATENFFPKANAIIFLLDASHLLSQKEGMFINLHFLTGGAPLKNIFFVVNKMNIIISRRKSM